MYLLTVTREQEGSIVSEQRKNFPSEQSFGCCCIPRRDRISNVQDLSGSCVGQLAQCDAMLDGRGWRTNASLSHLGMIWMLYGDVKDSLSRPKELLRSQRAAAARPSDPVCHQAFVSCQCDVSGAVFEMFPWR